MAEFKQKIHDLRVRVEKCLEELKNLEASGTESDASNAIWSAYGIWNSKEYGELEKALRAKGHKSSIDELNEKK